MRARSQLLTPHIESAFSLILSPDGKTLASGGEDHNVWLWSVEIGAWQALACKIANRNLTDEEWKQYLGNDGSRKDTCLRTK
jgi:WD40 repeat protein